MLANCVLRIAPVALLVACLGCQRSEIAKPISSAPDEVHETESQEAQTTTVAASQSTSPSPAAETDRNFDQTPSGVCQKFMELLQAGDRLGAENLLTRTSNANITKAGLKLEPMGGPGSTFSIGDVRFATNKQKLAQVDCRINEEIDGVSSSMDVVWQVRKRGIAWRISGVVLELNPDSAPDLLSFENPTDVAQMLSFASEEVLDETPTRQAEAPQAEEIK